MSNWFTSRFEKIEWRLCATIEVAVSHVDRITKARVSGTLYYYLYEDQHGERKFDAADTLRGDMLLSDLGKNDFVYRCEEYLVRVKPWINGRYDPEVKDYDQVPVEDFKRKLSKRK